MRESAVWKLVVVGAAFLPALAWQEAQQTESSPQVTRAVACLEVRDREPVSIDRVFSNQTPQIYCYTQVEGAAEPTEIEHVWIHQGEERARVTLPVRSGSWRTWSSKKMQPSWTGDWKVEVRDASGALLKTVEFSVTEEETGAARAEEEKAPGEGGTDEGEPE